MTAAPRLSSRDSEPEPTTLLELVRSVSQVTEDEGEIVATVLHMLRSGRVRLIGNFRNVPVEELA